MMRLQDFDVVVVTEDARRLFHELEQHVHGGGEIGSKHAGDDSDDFLEVVELLGRKSGGAHHHRRTRRGADRSVGQRRFRCGEGDDDVGICRRDNVGHRHSERAAPEYGTRITADGLMPGVSVR